MGIFPVNIQQLVEADKVLWFRIAGLCRAGVAVGPSADRPIAVVMVEARRDPQVALLLLPVARPKRSAAHVSVQVLSNKDAR
eukprot:1601743-Amphidinium_carterae.1